MPWPQATDYTAAVQNAAACFSDPALAASVPEMNLLLGTPLSYCGSFAIVFKLVAPNGEAWAAKCFIRQVTDQQERYHLISKHLEANKRKFAVDFDFQPEGIRIGGSAYPLVKMRWVEGFTLNEFLREHAGNGQIVGQLAGLWLRLAGEMREAGMAHGDLQHGNALLVPGGKASSMVLRLVDYDGMWVPALEGRPPGERGHPNYQHPLRLRQGGYSSESDRFSHLAIYAGLRRLAAGGKALWDRHDNGENLLFREADFSKPEKSKIWPEVLDLPDADALLLAGHLACASRGPLDAVPLLSELVSPSGAVEPLRAAQRDLLADLFPSVKAFRKAAIVPPVPAPSPPPPPPPPPDWLPPENMPVPAPGGSPRRSRLGAPRPPSAPLLPELPPMPAMSAVLTQEVPPLPSPLAAVLVPEVPPLPPKPRERAAASPMALAVASMVAALALFAVPAWWFWPARSAEGGVVVHAEGEPPVASVRAGKSVEVALRFAWKGDEPPALDLRLESPAHLNARVVGQEAREGGITYRVQASPSRHEAKERVALAAVLSSEGREAARATANIDIVPWLVRVGGLEPVVLKAGANTTLAAVVFSDDVLPPLVPELANLPAQVALESFELRPDGKLSLTLAAGTGAAESKRTVTMLLRDGSREAARASFSLTIVPGSTEPGVPVAVVPPPSALKLSGPDALVLGTNAATPTPIALQRSNLPGYVTLRAERLPVGVSMEPYQTIRDTAEIAFVCGPRAVAGKTTATIVATQGDVRLATWDIVLQVGDGKGPGIVVAPPMPMPKEDAPLPVRRMTFQTADGLSLEAKLWPVREPKDANTVLLLPDARRATGLDGAVTRLALALQKDGHTVLGIEFRGQGANRLKGAALPDRFYGSAPANSFLQANLAKTQRTQPGRLKPPLENLPASYSPWLVQDIIAARSFLDSLNDEGKANSNNLIVVALGESGHLATLWLATETLRATNVADDVPQSGDVRAMLLVGVPAFSTTWSSKSSHLGLLGKNGSLPPVHAIADGSSSGAGLYLSNLMRHKGVAINSTTTAKGTSPSYGHGLLSLDGVVDLAVQKVQKMPRRDWHAWRDRSHLDATFRWHVTRFPVVAKQSGEIAPQLFPLQQFGFPALSNGRF